MTVGIILAAGRGTRMETQTPKQYMELLGRPLMVWSMEVFEKSPCIDEIVLVTAPGEEEHCRREIVERFGFSKVKRIAAGGRERCHSVLEALKLLAPEKGDMVLIHDCARPLVSGEILERVIEGIRETGGAVAAVPVKDTIKKKIPGGHETLPRKELWAAQTPQGFETGLIREAYLKWEKAGADPAGITDDAMMLERFMGRSAKLVEGSNANFKVTQPEDLVMAEALLKRK